MLTGANYALDHEVDVIDSDEVLDAPKKQLAFVGEPTLASLTNPQALNSGGLHDIYIKRKDDFEEPELLEVQYNDGRGGLMREIIFVDPVYAEKRPRICVSIEGVQAMHRAIGVLSRKVDNLVNTLRHCRHAYYHELQALREQVFQVSYAKDHNKEAKTHTAQYFDPTQFDTSISEEVLERKVADATLELNDRLKVSKDEFQRLEKRLKMYEKDGAIDDPRSRVEKLLETVHLEKLMEMVKAAMGRGNVDEFFELLERMLGDYKSERGMDTEEKSLQLELEESKKQIVQLLEKENEHKARSAHQKAEIEMLKKNLVEERKLLNKELVGESDKLEALAAERNNLRDQLSNLEATLKKNREEAVQKESILQEQLNDITRQLGLKDQALKRHVVAKRIADTTAGKKLEHYSPEELVSTLSEKMNKKELGVIAFDLSCIMEEEDKTQLVIDIAQPLDEPHRKRVVQDVLKEGLPQSMMDEYFAHTKEDNLYAAVLTILKKLTDKAKRSDIVNLLMQDKEEEEMKTFAANLPEFARKSIVIDSLNALASTATSRESDSDSDVDLETVGKVIFDPSKDLMKRARRALLQRLFKRLPADEVKAISSSLGQKAREALYKYVFEDQNAEDLRRGISVIQEKDCLQAIADGLSEDAVELFMPMISERGGILARKASKDRQGGERLASAVLSLQGCIPKQQAPKPNRRVFDGGVQTDIAGVGTILLQEDNAISRSLSKRVQSPQLRKEVDVEEQQLPSPRGTEPGSPSPSGSDRGALKKRRQNNHHPTAPGCSSGKRKSRKPTVPPVITDDSVISDDQVSPTAEKAIAREASFSSRDTGTEPPTSPKSPKIAQISSQESSLSVGLQDPPGLATNAQECEMPTNTVLAAAKGDISNVDDHVDNKSEQPQARIKVDDGPKTGGNSLKTVRKSSDRQSSPSIAILAPTSQGVMETLSPYQSSDHRSVGSRQSMVSIDDEWMTKRLPVPAQTISMIAGFTGHDAEVQTSIRVEDKSFIVQDDQSHHERDVYLELSQLALYFLKTMEHTNVMRRARFSLDHYASAVDRTKALVNRQASLSQEISNLQNPEVLADHMGIAVSSLPKEAVSAAADFTRAVYEHGESSPQAKAAALALKLVIPLPQASPQEFAIASLQHQQALEREASVQLQASHTYSQGIAVAQTENAAVTYQQAVENHGVESEEAQAASHAYAHAMAIVQKEGAAANYHQVVQQHGKDSKEARVANQEYVHAMANAQAENAAVRYQQVVNQHGTESQEAVEASEAYNHAALQVQAENAALAYTQALVKHGLDSAEARHASEQYGQAFDRVAENDETLTMAEEAIETSTEAAVQFQKAIEENGGLSPQAIVASVDYAQKIAEEAGLQIEELTASVTHAHALRGQESTLPPQVLAAAAAYSQAMQEPELMSPMVKEASAKFAKILKKEGLPEKAQEAAALFAEAMEKQSQLPPQVVVASASQVHKKYSTADDSLPSRVQQHAQQQHQSAQLHQAHHLTDLPLPVQPVSHQHSQDKKIQQMQNSSPLHQMLPIQHEEQSVQQPQAVRQSVVRQEVQEQQQQVDHNFQQSQAELGHQGEDVRIVPLMQHPLSQTTPSHPEQMEITSTSDVISSIPLARTDEVTKSDSQRLLEPVREEFSTLEGDPSGEHREIFTNFSHAEAVQREPSQTLQRQDSEKSSNQTRGASLHEYSKALHRRLSVLSGHSSSTVEELANPLEIKGRSTLKTHNLVTLQHLSEHALELAEIADNRNGEEVAAMEPGKYIQSLAELSGISQEEVQAAVGDVVAEVGDQPSEARADTSSTWSRNSSRPVPLPLSLKAEESCSICGEVRLPDSVFCRKCGHRLTKHGIGTTGGVRRAPATAPDPHHSLFVAQRAFGKLRAGLRRTWTKKSTLHFASPTGGSSSHVGPVDWRKPLAPFHTHASNSSHSFNARHPPLPAHMRQLSGPLSPSKLNSSLASRSNTHDLGDIQKHSDLGHALSHGYPGAHNYEHHHGQLSSHQHVGTPYSQRGQLYHGQSSGHYHGGAHHEYGHAHDGTLVLDGHAEVRGHGQVRDHVQSIPHRHDAHSQGSQAHSPRHNMGRSENTTSKQGAPSHGHEGRSESPVRVAALIEDGSMQSDMQSYDNFSAKRDQSYDSSKEQHLQRQVEKQTVASSNKGMEDSKALRRSSTINSMNNQRRTSLERRNSHISLDFMKIDSSSRRGKEQPTQAAVNWQAELNALPAALDVSQQGREGGSEDSASLRSTSSRGASRGRHAIQEDRRRSRDLSREARRLAQEATEVPDKSDNNPYKNSTISRVMHATINHKDNEQLLEVSVAKQLQKQVEKQIKSEAYQDVRRVIDEIMGPDERRDLESSVTAAAMQGFMAISDFLKRNDRELSPVQDKAKLLADTKSDAMKVAVNNALKVYHAVGTDVGTPDCSPSRERSKTPPHSYPPVGRSSHHSSIMNAKRGSIMTAPAGQRQSILLGSPRKFGVGEIGRSSIADIGVGLGLGLPEARKLVNEQSPLEEEPPTRAANAAEWLDFFQGKRRKDGVFHTPGGFGGLDSHRPTFAGIAGTGLVKSKLKPLRTPRGPGKTLMTAEGIINASRADMQPGGPDNDVQCQSARATMVSQKSPPRMQEFDSGLELHVSNQPKFSRSTQALGKSARPDFLKKASATSKASTRTSFEDAHALDSEQPAPPEASFVEPSAPLSSRSAKNIAASRVELAAGDLLSGIESSPVGQTTPCTMMKDRRKREVRKLPALSQLTAEKVIAAGRSAQAGQEVKLLIEQKLGQVVPNPKNSTQEDCASSSRSSSIESRGEPLDHDTLKLIGQTKQQEATAPSLQLSNDLSALQFSLRPKDIPESHESQSARGRMLMGTGLASDDNHGSLTDRAIIPASKLGPRSGTSRQRVGLRLVGPLVSRVKEQLEGHYGSLAAAWVSIESKTEGGLTLGSMQKGLVQAGISPEDAGHFLQAIIEQNSGTAGAAIPGDRAPGRADFLGALIPGKLPQTSLDAAHRRSSLGSAWWSEGRISPNFRMASVQDGISSRDAHTILTARNGL